MWGLISRAEFFFFLNFILFSTLHNCISFAIYQNESTTGIHVFPTLNPPPSPYHPSGSSQCTSPKHPVSCIKEPEQCGQGGYMCRERGQTQCGWGTVSTRQCYLFAASLPPSPQRDWTSEPKKKKKVPFVSGRKPDTEESSKQKKL